jgi:hypothetical protein
MAATCSLCEREMTENTSCDTTQVIVFEDGSRENPIRVGGAGDPTTSTCHDCNAPTGGYHHPMCDMERCPKCGGQLISCKCHVKHTEIEVEE